MLKPLQPFSFGGYETTTKGVVFQGARGNFRMFPLCPLESPAPPDDLGPNGALRTRTHKATYNRLVLLAFLNIAPPIAALSGEK